MVTNIIWLCLTTGTHSVFKSHLVAISMLWNAQLFLVITFLHAFDEKLLNKKAFDQNWI